MIRRPPLARYAGALHGRLSAAPGLALLATAAALLAGTAWAALAPETGVPGALKAVARAAAGAVLVALLGQLVWRLLFPEEHVDGSGSPAGTADAEIAPDPGAPPLSLRAEWAQLDPWWIVLLGGVLVAAALMRSPHRLIAVLLGYAVVGVPLVWASAMRAGPEAARRAALAVALLTFLPTHVNVPEAPKLVSAEAGSAYRWTAGWPSEAWALAHEIRLAAPRTAPLDLVLHLAAPYTGRGRVAARLNGRELGMFRGASSPEFLTLEVPAEALAGQTTLRLELRLAPYDPTLRLAAHRWTTGASLGAGASSYFDGERWHAGTFDDVLGRAAPGIYALELQPR